MMQRIWAAIAATWAVIAIFVVLAASQAPPQAATSATGTALVGKATAHATTSSSAAPSGTTSASGSATQASQPVAVTRSS